MIIKQLILEITEILFIRFPIYKVNWKILKKFITFVQENFKKDFRRRRLRRYVLKIFKNVFRYKKLNMYIEGLYRKTLKIIFGTEG